MSTSSDQLCAYRITVLGRLDPSWSSWFDGQIIEGPNTDHSATAVLIGPVIDQPTLRGLLNKLWDLNLILVSVIRLDNEVSAPQEAHYVTPIHSPTR